MAKLQVPLYMTLLVELGILSSHVRYPSCPLPQTVKRSGGTIRVQRMSVALRTLCRSRCNNSSGCQRQQCQWHRHRHTMPQHQHLGSAPAAIYRVTLTGSLTTLPASASTAALLGLPQLWLTTLPRVCSGVRDRPLAVCRVMPSQPQRTRIRQGMCGHGRSSVSICPVRRRGGSDESEAQRW